MLMSASETIRKIRIHSHLGVEEFAKELGIDKGSVSRYENGFQKPRMNVIRKIITYANKKNIQVSVEDFFD